MPWPPCSGERRALLPSRAKSAADLPVDRDHLPVGPARRKRCPERRSDSCACARASLPVSSRCRERAGLFSITGDKPVDLLHARLNSRQRCPRSESEAHVPLVSVAAAWNEIGSVRLLEEANAQVPRAKVEIVRGEREEPARRGNPAEDAIAIHPLGNGREIWSRRIHGAAHELPVLCWLQGGHDDSLVEPA